MCYFIIKNFYLSMQSQVPFILQIIPLFFLFFVFYFFIILPQKKRQKEFKEMISSIKKNDEVVTIGGIHGVVVNIKENTFIIRVDDNTKIEIDKFAVARKKK